MIHDDIRTLRHEVLDTEQKTRKLEQEINTIKTETIKKIEEMADNLEPGDKSLSNQTKRTAAIEKMLNENTEYQKKLEIIEQNKFLIKEKKIEIDYLKMEFKLKYDNSCDTDLLEEITRSNKTKERHLDTIAVALNKLANFR
jgi:uncharacterized protein (DUF3084 family)